MIIEGLGLFGFSILILVLGIVVLMVFCWNEKRVKEMIFLISYMMLRIKIR